jgi:hypothetical protein
MPKSTVRFSTTGVMRQALQVRLGGEGKLANTTSSERECLVIPLIGISHKKIMQDAKIYV